jgi:altronate dehydratase
MSMDLKELAVLLVGLGCPPAKVAEMAAQLDKRARQLAEQKGRPYEDALAHLLGLMRQGWAAKESGSVNVASGSA